MINVSGLAHSFESNNVLKDVDFNIADKRVVGLVGINGAGKSTLLRLMSGVYKVQEGKVTYDGRSPEEPSTRQDIFLLPDDPYYTNNSTCRSLFDLYSTLYPNAEKAVFYSIIGEFGLPDKKPIRSFSKGMRRQVFVALAFAISPKYLLLDEAFDGLDPLARKKFKDRIRALVNGRGTTVIISSHSLKELDDFCDEYLLIEQGNVISTEGKYKDNEEFCKYQLAFADQIDEKLFSDLPVVSLKIIGRVATLTLNNEEGIEDRLNALNPVIMDRLEVTFEEAFISGMEVKS
ncbi:ABC-2 type transport system ATP-binding protein [Ruminococcaceae bacterium YRB3002]|nr:ABC-2 type transport system ATP-binding protein [Ruminococcaceae bacterium YRB3002]